MKKTLLFLFLTVFALSFSACGSDDDNDDNLNKSLKVSAYYNMQNSEYEYPDQNAKVYILIGIGYDDKSKYEYRGEGKFYQIGEGHWATPFQTLSTGSSVFVTTEIDYDCTVVVESAYYEGEYLVKTKALNDQDRGLKFVFSVPE